MENITLEYTDIFDGKKTKKLVFSKHLLKEGFKESSLLAILVDGKSMEPTIFDRSLVVADLSQKELMDEKIYLLYYEDKMWIKKYKKEDDTFISINPKFSHLVYKNEEIHLVARVLLTFSSF